MHHTDTLGRRIQAYRKKSGLSQEALGEQLRVSRQAVSQWESDGTIPELDSLIAMGRIFGVSIGELLGVEPPRPAGNPEEWTEQQRKAAEAIAVRYAAEAERLTKPHRSRRLAAILLLCVLLVGGAVWVGRQLTLMEQRFDQLQQQVDDINTNMAVQLSRFSGELNNIMAETASILNNSAVTIVGFDIEAQTLTLRLSAAPREWTETATAIFTVDAGDEIFTSEPLSLENGAFIWEDLTVPMSESVSVSVSLTDGGVTQVEPLETLDGCMPENFLLNVDGYCQFSYHPNEEPPYTASLSHLTIYQPIISQFHLDLVPTSVELCLYRGQETEPEQTVSLPEAVLQFQEEQDGSLHIQSLSDRSLAFSLAADETVVLALRVADNHGGVVMVPQRAYRGGTGTLDVVLDDWQPGDLLPES